MPYVPVAETILSRTTKSGAPDASVISVNELVGDTKLSETVNPIHPIQTSLACAVVAVVPVLNPAIILIHPQSLH